MTYQPYGLWDYSILPGNVRIGKDCYLEDYGAFARFRSTQDRGLTIGDGVYAYLGTTFDVSPPGVLSVGAGSVLASPVFKCSCSVTVGRNVLISYGVLITDNDMHPRGYDARLEDARAHSPQGGFGPRPPLEMRPVVIDDDVVLGAGVIVLKGVRIGRGAHVAAGSVVTRDVPEGARVAGNPARALASGE